MRCCQAGRRDSTEGGRWSPLSSLLSPVRPGYSSQLSGRAGTFPPVLVFQVHSRRSVQRLLFLQQDIISIKLYHFTVNHVIFTKYENSIKIISSRPEHRALTTRLLRHNNLNIRARRTGWLAGWLLM